MPGAAPLISRSCRTSASRHTHVPSVRRGRVGCEKAGRSRRHYEQSDFTSKAPCRQGAGCETAPISLPERPVLTDVPISNQPAVNLNIPRPSHRHRTRHRTYNPVDSSHDRNTSIGTHTGTRPGSTPSNLSRAREFPRLRERRRHRWRMQPGRPLRTGTGVRKSALRELQAFESPVLPGLGHLRSEH